MFECDKCGQCCSHIGVSSFYKDLDRGDGVCKYLKGNLCSIYEQRPLLCRLDEGWATMFSSDISLEAFYELNYQGCRILKSNDKKENE